MTRSLLKKFRFPLLDGGNFRQSESDKFVPITAFKQDSNFATAEALHIALIAVIDVAGIGNTNDSTGQNHGAKGNERTQLRSQPN